MSRLSAYLRSRAESDAEAEEEYTKLIQQVTDAAAKAEAAQQATDDLAEAVMELAAIIGGDDA